MGRRLALLIASYEYQDSGLRRLTAPAHDAHALAAVLEDPQIAGYEVTILVNEPHHRVGDAVGRFYQNGRRDDLTLLYFTGHGLKDDGGRLYLAMTNTRRDSLLFTGLSAQAVDEAMDGCVSQQKLLILDCCYSGAYPAGRMAKADAAVHTLKRFQGKGRTVLTASDATQYAFEGERLHGQAPRSVFTRYLVEGLREGSADLDSDGDITVDELYTYVHDRVVDEMPQQRPKKQENVQGRTVIARNVNWALPPYLRHLLSSPLSADRLAAFDGLDHLLRIGNDLVKATVRAELACLADDDCKTVAAAATGRLDALVASQAGAPEHAPPGRRLPSRPEAAIDSASAAPIGFTPSGPLARAADATPAGRVVSARATDGPLIDAECASPARPQSALGAPPVAVAFEPSPASRRWIPRSGEPSGLFGDNIYAFLTEADRVLSLLGEDDGIHHIVHVREHLDRGYDLASLAKRCLVTSSLTVFVVSSMIYRDVGGDASLGGYSSGWAMTEEIRRVERAVAAAGIHRVPFNVILPDAFDYSPEAEGGEEMHSQFDRAEEYRKRFRAIRSQVGLIAVGANYPIVQRLLKQDVSDVGTTVSGLLYPDIRNLTIDDMVRVRQDHEDSFVRLKRALQKYLRGLGTVDSEPAYVALVEELDDQCRQTQNEFEQIRRRHTSSLGGMVVTTSLVGVATATSAVSPTFAAVAAAATGSAGLTSFIQQRIALKSELTSLERSNFWFALQLHRRGDATRSGGPEVAVQQGSQPKHPGQNIDRHSPICRNSFHR
ncbi:caspase family protein [Frankia sp. CiP3]|uniref:caspase family protein n=1 Tax=Frankia sp. CiP3 TaxID=2880971 RepID=UPI001EF5AAF3|nr:caspase family protein [Frankia sp. CiP3]